MKYLSLKTVFITSIIGGMILVLSMLGFRSAISDYLFFVAILFVYIWLGWKDTRWAIIITVAELALGGNGYLFVLPLGAFSLSLRMAFFVALLVIWMIKAIGQRRLVDTRDRPVFVTAIVFLAYALVISLVSLWRGNSPDVIFADVNGYLYWLLLLPFLSVTWDKNNLRKLCSILLGAVLVSASLVLVFSAYFNLTNAGGVDPETVIAERAELTSAKDESAAEFSQTVKWDMAKLVNNKKRAGILYLEHWAKERGLTEVSYAGNNIFRVYHRSHVYHLLAVSLLVLFVFSRWHREKLSRHDIWPLLLLLLILASLGLSFARSLWLGLAMTLIGSLFLMTKKRAVLVGGVLIFSLTVVMIMPGTRVALIARVLSIFNPGAEYASSARLVMLVPTWEHTKEHLIFGQGFGSTVKYFSPAPENYGWVIKYMVEWGYLDMLHDLGIIGCVIYALLIWFVLRRGDLPDRIRGASLLATIGLLIIHITTPYLNHPLGISLLQLNALKKDES